MGTDDFTGSFVLQKPFNVGMLRYILYCEDANKAIPAKYGENIFDVCCVEVDGETKTIDT